MAALWILGILLALILLLLLLRVGVHVRFGDALCVTAMAGPVRLQLVPKPEKKKPEKENSRSDNKPKKKNHTVKGNDTLRSIAKKYYGSGSYANKIYNANKTVIEKAAKKHGRVSSAHNGVNGWYIYDGTKLVIP